MSETTAQQTGQASVGATLKAAREARKLDIDDVCGYLRLSRRQIVALENNDFSVLPEPTITRGFIRNYARMLELDAQPLLAEYGRYAVTDEARPITIQSANIPIRVSDKRPWQRYILASVLVLLALGVWVLYVDYVPRLRMPQRATPPAAVAPLPESTAEAETEAAPAVATALAETPDEPAGTVEMPPDDASTPTVSQETAAPQATATPQAADGQAAIGIRASADSWVRITGRDGKLVYDNLMAPNSTATVYGVPPLQIVIGNAPATTLTYNGQAVDLAPVTQARVARLKLE